VGKEFGEEGEGSGGRGGGCLLWLSEKRPLLFARQAPQQRVCSRCSRPLLTYTPCCVCIAVCCLPYTALSCFSSLRALSIMHPEGSPHLAPDDDPDFDPELEPPLLPGLGIGAMAAPAAGAAAAAAGGSNDGSSQRSLPWWTLPKGLMSLCLSHMDLSGRGVNQCGEPSRGAAAGGSNGSGGCCCCLAPAPVGQQQRQQLLSGLGGLGLSLFQSRPSPLRPQSKRRRQTQQRTDQQDTAAAAAGGAAAAAGTQHGSYSDDGSSAVGAADGTAGDELQSCQSSGLQISQQGLAAEPQLCSCSTVLPAHFSGLQALWFEHVTLPATWVSRVLPVLATSLESLALLHVSGTAPEEMGSLSSLTALTSLRLIPSDHDVGGLEPLLTMRHLKKLSIK